MIFSPISIFKYIIEKKKLFLKYEDWLKNNEFSYLKNESY